MINNISKLHSNYIQIDLDKINKPKLDLNDSKYDKIVNPIDGQQKQMLAIENKIAIKTDSEYKISIQNDKYIEDIHNYSQPLSKRNNHLNEMDIKNYMESDDDEDEETNINNNYIAIDDSKVIKPIINMDETPPDHHTRRPMNAFLMFCKKHRSIVKEKFPNFENRVITKILGDWWAKLEEHEKTCYTELAKSYKDAFFNANPDFKWYKLPAPPKRTLAMRPNFDRPYSEESYEDSYFSPKSNQVLDTCKEEVSAYSNVEQSMIIPKMDIIHKQENEIPNLINKPVSSSVNLFRLADETQMGGLNSLMHISANNNNTNACNDAVAESDVNNPTVVDDQESNSAKDKSKFVEPFAHMKIHAAKMNLDSITFNKNSSNLKRKAEDLTDLSHSKKLHLNDQRGNTNEGSESFYNNTDNRQNNTNINDSPPLFYNEVTEYDQLDSKKSSRACKGKRYQEFMITGKLQQSNKKPKPNKIISTPTTFPHNSYCKVDKDAQFFQKDAGYENNSVNVNRKIDFFNDTERSQQSQLISPNSSSSSGKLFDSSEFDLDEKIKALPFLNLDLFMVRKREIKKKKKLSRKNKAAKSSTNVGTKSGKIQDAHQNSIVGSQKRKARKESITRLDVLQITENNNLEIPKQLNIKIENNNSPASELYSPEIMTPTETSQDQSSASDLLILATLAEEEANKTKLQL